MIRITGPAFVLLLTAIFLFLAATNIQAGWLYLVDAFLWSLLLFSILIPFLQIRRLEVKRIIKPVCYKEQLVKIELLLKNNSYFSVYFLSINDFIAKRIFEPSKKLTPGDDNGFIILLKSKETFKHVYEVKFSTRGVHKFVQTEIISYGPFGLIGVAWKLNYPSYLAVYPNIPNYQQQKSFKFSVGEEIFRPTSKKAQSNYISHFRDYQPGDNIRHIHWKNSARQNKLILYEMLEIQGQEAHLVLDTFKAQINSTFENQITLAGQIALEFLNKGYSIQLYAQEAEDSLWPENLLPKRTVKNISSWTGIAHWLAYLEQDSPILLKDWISLQNFKAKNLIILSNNLSPEDLKRLNQEAQQNDNYLTLISFNSKLKPMSHEDRIRLIHY